MLFSAMSSLLSMLRESHANCRAIHCEDYVSVCSLHFYFSLIEHLTFVRHCAGPWLQSSMCPSVACAVTLRKSWCMFWPSCYPPAGPRMEPSAFLPASLLKQSNPNPSPARAVWVNPRETKQLRNKGRESFEYIILLAMGPRLLSAPLK